MRRGARWNGSQVAVSAFRSSRRGKRNDRAGLAWIKAPGRDRRSPGRPGRSVDHALTVYDEGDDGGGLVVLAGTALFAAASSLSKSAVS